MALFSLSFSSSSALASAGYQHLSPHIYIRSHNGRLSSQGFSCRICCFNSLQAYRYCLLSQMLNTKCAYFVQASTVSWKELCYGSTRDFQKRVKFKYKTALRYIDSDAFGGLRAKNGVVCWTKADPEERALETAVDSQKPELPEGKRKILQASLWTMVAIYIGCLFLSPYAPGDPVWAIKHETVLMIADLSLNFFFILPLLNAAGIDFMEAPVLHPASEALFNFVMGWTVMFAPLIFTDRKRKQFRGSLEMMWLGQMFLTNVFLIPYMAIRIGSHFPEEQESPQLESASKKHGIIYTALTSGAQIVGLVGCLIGLVSLLWAIAGRSGEEFGNLADRSSFLYNYVSSDRLAYAFVWDIVLYSLFQPWLIGDNIEHVDEEKQSVVKVLRFIPYFGLAAYLWGLSRKNPI